jgi:aerobic C4-dicarboxylate transport protein
MAKPIYKNLTVMVLIAIVLGVLLGHFAPVWGAKMEPLSTGFLNLIKMVVAPIIFCTVVSGIAGMEDMKSIGKTGGLALLYFEVVSTIALIIGLVLINVAHPGQGMNADLSQISAADTEKVAGYIAKGKTTVQFFLDMIPSNVVAAFAGSDILPVLVFSILFGFALHRLGKPGHAMLDFIERFSHVLFGIVGIIMYAAPIGTFGAIAFTVGKFGIGSLVQLGALIGWFFAACAIFVVVVLGLIAKSAGFSIFKFIRYIREELFIVIGTSSSETVLPRMIRKMEELGCKQSVVKLVIPTGYSFNLDGTAIYLTMAAIFIGQATNTPLTLSQEIGLLFVLMLTSKGAAAVTGGGFIVLAATLSATGTVPVAGVALILGIDRFMSGGRALTNLIGNGVATVVVSKWCKQIDEKQMREHLA